MPLQRRVPKFGFTSPKARDTAEVRLDALAKIDADVIDLAALKAVRMVRSSTKRVKVIASGALKKPVWVRGLMVSRGARAAIETVGGNVEAADKSQTGAEQP